MGNMNKNKRKRIVSRELIVDAIQRTMTGEDRLDANQTAVLARQLEHQLSMEKEVGYRPLKALSFFPVSTEIDPGAESFRYEEYDGTGVAKIVGNYADDLPMVDVVANEVFGSVKSVANGYQYSRQDLRRAAMSGKSLPQRKRRLARLAVDRKIDEIMSFGEAAAKLRGVLNHPNITVIAASLPGAGSDPEWGGADKTTLEILDDLHELADRVWLDTYENYMADTLLLPPERFSHVARTPMSADNSKTILQSFLESTRFIRNVDSWHKLSTAGADGGPAALAYRRSPEVLEAHMAMTFTEHEPQVKNLAFLVPCEARTGGVSIYEPLAVVRMDGV